LVIYKNFKYLQDIKNGLLKEMVCVMTCGGSAKFKMSINLLWSGKKTLPLQITCLIYKH